MKTIVAKLLMCVVVVVASFSCGTSRHYNQDKYIKVFESSRSENFTNEQLTNLMKQPGYMPSIVVRNISNSTTSVSNNSNTHRLCSILEMGLAKNQMDVRDRGLFDNVLASMKNGGGIVDYSKIYEATQVDLLMEISSYDLSIPFKVDKYYIGNNGYFFPEEERIVQGQKQKYIPTYTLRGMSITIKVIMLQNNLIGGTYSFTYVPCSAEEGGALVTSLTPLRYRPVGNNRDMEAILNDDSQTAREYSYNEKLDAFMEDFITYSVVPDMVAYMKGETPKQSFKNQSSAQSNQQKTPAGAAKSSFFDAQHQMNQPEKTAESQNVEQYQRRINELTAELLATGLYTEQEVHEMITNQLESNTRVIQSNPRYIKNTLSTKEKMMKKMYSSQSEKDRQFYADKIKSIDKDLETQGYYDFNDYSYLEKEINSNHKGTHSLEQMEEGLATMLTGAALATTGIKDISIEEQVSTAEVNLVNSYGDMSEAISGLIRSEFDKQTRNELAQAKKSKADKLRAEIQKMDSDLKKLQYISREARTRINKFISSSSFVVGAQAPESSDEIILFMHSAEEQMYTNEAIYVLIDDQCVGCGTSINGFYVSIPSSKFNDSFHEIKIVSSPIETGKELTELFSSSVMFKIRKEFVYDYPKGQIRIITLNIQ